MGVIHRPQTTPLGNPRTVALTLLVISAFVSAVRFLGLSDSSTAGNNLVALDEISDNANSATINSNESQQRVYASSNNDSGPLNGKFMRVGPEDIWKDLLREATRMMNENPSMAPFNAMEVGMHKAKQCVQAATAGLHAHCVEPSPRSFKRVEWGVSQVPKDVQDRIKLHNVAAGDSSGGTVPFFGKGGTGDHVGTVDAWKMEELGEGDMEKVIQVPSKRLDDIVKPLGDDGVFLIKVDTQGFEPNVFAGLSESLTQHKIQYVLTEYWPRGMDLLANNRDGCVGVPMLQKFVDAGYKLYMLGVQAHPAAGKSWRSITKELPLDDLERNCRYFLDIEERFPNANYNMGYWTDVLAVAPTAKMEGTPTTATGNILKSLLSSS